MCLVERLKVSAPNILLKFCIMHTGISTKLSLRATRKGNKEQSFYRITVEIMKHLRLAPRLFSFARMPISGFPRSSLIDRFAVTLACFTIHDLPAAAFCRHFSHCYTMSASLQRSNLQRLR